MTPEIKNHFGKLSRIVGNNLNTRYSYIISESDLTNAYLQMRNDLGYPLMVDSKYRRAIIYNKQGIEKQIQNMITEVIEENATKMADLVINEVTMQLNSIKQLANGQIVSSGGRRTNGLSTTIGTAIGKGLVNGFFKVIDDITCYDDNRR